jgi:hypothetical protein
MHSTWRRKMDIRCGINHPCIDPTTDVIVCITTDNHAILASVHGHYDVVKRLLQDDRVDPGAHDSRCVSRRSCFALACRPFCSN